MKTCTTCGETKPLTDFRPHKTCRGGYLHACRVCLAAKDHETYMLMKDMRSEWSKEYYRANKAAFQERHRNGHLKRVQDPEWVQRKREYNRSYASKNLVKRNEDNKKRRERLANAPVNDFTPEQWEALKQAYQARCAYCSRELAKFHTDHVIPLARHGEHSARNIVPSCGPCNTRKATRPNMPFQVIPTIDRRLHDWLISAH